MSKKRLNKADLVDAVAEELNLSNAEVQRVIETAFRKITSSVHDDRVPVTINRFGTFTSSSRKAREARNPKTREIVHVPPKEIFIFKASKNLRELQ